MSPEQRREAWCPGCEKKSWVVTRPVYDGLRKAGETRHCFFCGHQFPDDENEIEFVEHETSAIFDRDAARKVCGHCRHFVIHPFTQKCAADGREVTALDSCNRWELKPHEKG